MKTALSVLKIVVSVGLLTLLLSRADGRALLSQFTHMSWRWTAAALVAYTAMLATSAWRWRLLLQTQKIDVRLGHLTKSFLVATFFNNFLPSNIGGDVIRIADTAPHTARATIVALGLFRVVRYPMRFLSNHPIRPRQHIRRHRHTDLLGRSQING